MELPLLPGLATILLVLGGIYVAPFDWVLPGVERDPIPVDAIPDTADNQQIILTTWPGRSPQDVEDQITYPLTSALLGVTGVKSLRCSSMFGRSSIHVVFDDDVDFYDSRSYLLERLAGLGPSDLPKDVKPTLGPDASALGQVFWYTLEGRGPDGEASGGWDLGELRSIQDWNVRLALASVPGVAEVASIGGFVEEFQVDVDPARLLAHGVTLAQVFEAIRKSNVDVGARTMEINRAEYVVRGLGRIESTEDLESVALRAQDGVPITLRQVADVHRGPALRRGALDRGGQEAVGGVVVARFGANPLQVIRDVKERVREIAPGLPTKQLPGGGLSRVTLRPFYDRSELIQETLGTLSLALRNQVLLTAVVVLAMLAHLRSAVLVSCLLPLAVLGAFIGMRSLGVDANVVALGGIAIAIGTLVDIALVLVENIIQHLDAGQSRRERIRAIAHATGEVGAPIITAVLTTLIGFLPVFALSGPEGKLFTPLALTKTLALLASIAIAFLLFPAAARFLLSKGVRRAPVRRWPSSWVAALGLALFGWQWAPAGPQSPLSNVLLAWILLGGFILGFLVLQAVYEPVLRWCLAHKLAFLSMPVGLVLLGATAWLGAERTLGWLPPGIQTSRPMKSIQASFPGLGKEFMPRLDEGSFLLMPVTMAHASIGEAMEMMQQQCQRIRSIPEVREVTGKIGRAESALDPAPISMVETLVSLEPEFAEDENGERHRQWRGSIRGQQDIWNEIAAAAELPGMTSASMLQPIETRRIMLQTGMRAPMGVKVFAPDLDTLEAALSAIEPVLRQAPGVHAPTVFADRVVGKPFIEIDLDRNAIARHGLSIQAVQDVIEVALGGRALTTVHLGRERLTVRARYARELRDSPDALETVLVPTPQGARIPLGQLSRVKVTRGPQVLRSEDSFLVGYVLFDAQAGWASADVARGAETFLTEARAQGKLELPPSIRLRFAGEYQNQVRAAATLRIVLPLSLALIAALLYLLLRSIRRTAIVFSAVLVAWSGGFLLLWLYGQSGFLDVNLLGVNLADLFGVQPIHLSVAVWVGFLALFGIATDDGVILSTYLRQALDERQPKSTEDLREAVVQAGLRRVRPCLMTTATTTLALIPVLSSQGKGSQIMIPMAIPTFGGMLVVLLTLFLVPTLTSAMEESKLRSCALPAPSNE